MLYMKPKLLTVTNHDTMLNLGCDCGVWVLNTPKARIVKRHSRPKNLSLIKFDLLGGFIACLGNLVIVGWSKGI